MKNWKTTVAVIALATVFIGGMAPRSWAQDDPNNKKISLALTDADVRDAIQLLFKGLGVSYQIAPEVQGKITIDYKDQPFETALRGILDQVNATWRLESGIYQIVIREKVTPSDPTGTEFVAPERKKIVQRIPLKHADPQYVFYMLSGMLDWYLQPEMTTAGGGGNGGGGGYGNNNNNGNNNNGYNNNNNGNNNNRNGNNNNRNNNNNNNNNRNNNNNGGFGNNRF